MKNLLIVFILLILTLNATELDELYNKAKNNHIINDWEKVIINSVELNNTKYLEESKRVLWNIMKKKDPSALEVLSMFGVNSKDDLPKFIMKIEKDKKVAKKRQERIKEQKIKNRISLGKTLQVGVVKITLKYIDTKTLTYIDTVSHQKTISKYLCINFEIENTSTTETVTPIESGIIDSIIYNEYKTKYYDDTTFLISRGIKDFKYKEELLPQKNFITYVPFGFGLNNPIKGKEFSAEIQFVINSKKDREKIYFDFKESDIK